MAKCIFLFWLFLASSCMAGAQDTVELSFGRIGGRSGDTAFLYLKPALTARPGTDSTFERFFNKNLRGIYPTDTMIAGTVIAWFVIDQDGKCTAGNADTTGTRPEIAQEVLRVIHRINDRAVMPTRIGGRPVISRVKMRVVFRFWGGEGYPPPLTGPKPDILVTGWRAVS